jgi:hypothetical protein
MQEDNFWSFTEAIESGPHDNVPNNICGDFFSVDSPNGIIRSLDLIE